VLSASRSSFLAVILLGLIVIFRSRHRAVLFTVAVIGSAVALSLMTDLQRDRYLSIVSSDTKSSATAEGRVSGVLADLTVAQRKPLFGYGLGTSREANANFRGEDKPSHDLFTEVAQELGFVGLFLFLTLIAQFIRSCYAARAIVSASPGGTDDLKFLDHVASSLLVLMFVYIFFSFASYGLSEPYWYFIGGLSVATARLARERTMGGVAGALRYSEPRVTRRALWPRGTRVASR
jgi:O-antigen ligase